MTNERKPTIGDMTNERYMEQVRVYMNKPLTRGDLAKINLYPDPPKREPATFTQLEIDAMLSKLRKVDDYKPIFETPDKSRLRNSTLYSIINRIRSGEMSEEEKSFLRNSSVSKIASRINDTLTYWGPYYRPSSFWACISEYIDLANKEDLLRREKLRNRPTIKKIDDLVETIGGFSLFGMAISGFAEIGCLITSRLDKLESYALNGLGYSAGVFCSSAIASGVLRYYRKRKAQKSIEEPKQPSE